MTTRGPLSTKGPLSQLKKGPSSARDGEEEAAGNGRDPTHQKPAKFKLWPSPPDSRQYKILNLVVGRLQDKSSNVRKQAVLLLTSLLQCNPYNATLPVEELKESYKRELEKLTAMKPQARFFGLAFAPTKAYPLITPFRNHLREID